METQTPQSQARRNNFGNRGGFGDRGPRRDTRPPREKSEFETAVLDIARVTRVTKGGKRFSFRATVALGDGHGRVGIGVAQGIDVAQSMQKASNQAKKNMITIPIFNETIPHEIKHKYGSAVVILKPARLGSGVKAGGPVRVIAKLGGLKNVTAKLIERTGNKINIARATIEALKSLRIKK